MASNVLVNDHEELSDLLQDLQQSLTSDTAGKYFQLLDLFWARLAVHIRAEHLCLFPAILKSSSGLFGQGEIPPYEEARSIIESLRTDHNFFMDELANSIKLGREMMDETFASEFGMIRDSVNAVAQRLESHNVTEEQQVYLWPRTLLDKNQLEHLKAAINHELQNLPPRFQ